MYMWPLFKTQLFKNQDSWNTLKTSSTRNYIALSFVYAITNKMVTKGPIGYEYIALNLFFVEKNT